MHDALVVLPRTSAFAGDRLHRELAALDVPRVVRDVGRRLLDVGRHDVIEFVNVYRVGAKSSSCGTSALDEWLATSDGALLQATPVPTTASARSARAAEMRRHARSE